MSSDEFVLNHDSTRVGEFVPWRNRLTGGNFQMVQMDEMDLSSPEELQVSSENMVLFPTQKACA